MFTLQIEHGIKDFAMWRNAYKADPLGRTSSGVLAQRVARPLQDDHQVIIDLDFATASQAQAFLERLRTQVWNVPAAAPALAGAPQCRILVRETVGP